MSDERSPLLQFPAAGSSSTHQSDHHDQFCHLIGTRPINLPPGQKHEPHPESLYHRAVSQKKGQHRSYVFTATLTNTLILSQVVLGAALTGLGASDSSHILITIFGAMNTIIAGLIAWLKSRGQPMRARMFRDDLERVVDEIENSAMMWLGISKNVHGYDKIDTDDQVTVRSEVARLTRLYDRAVKTNTLNDPDMYSTGAPTDPHNAALRTGGGQSGLSMPPPPPPSVPATATVPVSGPPPPEVAVIAPAAQDPDASPATEAPQPEAPKPEDSKVESGEGKDGSKGDAASKDGKPSAADSDGKDDAAAKAGARSSSPDAPNGQAAAGASAAPPSDPDESPASAAVVKKHTEDTSSSDERR